MTLTNGKQEITLSNESHIEAFKNAGWLEKKEEKPKTAPKSKKI